MYNFIKKLLLVILPTSLILQSETLLRKIWSVFYIGNNFKCNICESKLRKFIKYDQDLICPTCGSLSRDRRLYSIISTSYLSKNISILDFSPSRNLYRKLKIGDFHYTSSAFAGDFFCDVNYDITDIPVADSKYDIVICYHILEHIIDDIKAIKELFRILKIGGTCLIQTPFKNGEIFEDYTIITNNDRKHFFGQEDHVRIYSVDGLKKRLSDNGFIVTILNFHEENNNRFGFNISETVLICKKG